MKRRGTPEADLQRAVVQTLHVALPRTAIIHHCANEVTEAGPRGAKRQAILVGMGVHAGFADLMVLCDGRVLFLELKAPKGRLRPTQEAFRDAVLAQGFGWALVRSLDDALGALADPRATCLIGKPVLHLRDEFGLCGGQALIVDAPDQGDIHARPIIRLPTIRTRSGLADQVVIIFESENIIRADQHIRYRQRHAVGRVRDDQPV
jgi:hypothetical protein